MACAFLCYIYLRRQTPPISVRLSCPNFVMNILLSRACRLSCLEISGRPKYHLSEFHESYLCEIVVSLLCIHLLLSAVCTVFHYQSYITMDKLNELDLQDHVKLEDILVTAFLQVADSNLLGKSLRAQNLKANTCSCISLISSLAGKERNP